MDETLVRLVRDYYHPVKARLGRLVEDSDKVEELTQEVFLVACGSLSRRTDVNNPAGFLFGIAFKVFQRHLRNKYNAVQALHTDMSSIASNEPAPADVVEWDDTDAQVRSILSRLDVIDQQIVMATQMFDLSSTEVGQTLDMPRAKVRYRLTRALEQIRAMAETQGLTMRGYHGAE